jgi:hypothetical protein
MLLLGIGLCVVGYSLLYASIRGDNASINGTPLWKAPWLPFVAAFSGAASTSSTTSTGSGNYGSTSVGANQAEASVNTFVADIQRGAQALRTGVFNALSAARTRSTGA